MEFIMDKNSINKLLERRKELYNDIVKLNNMKKIYESTSDFLSGGFYSDFMEVLNEQISEVEKAYNNIDEQAKTEMGTYSKSN